MLCVIFSSHTVEFRKSIQMTANNFKKAVTDVLFDIN